jgi:hypothetical protein
VRILVTPISRAGADTADRGAWAFEQAIPFRSRCRDYFLNKPRLSTSTLGALTCMQDDLLYQDSGARALLGPGGNSYLGLEITLTIAMRGAVSRIS